MPTIILDKKAFLKSLGKKLSDEELKDRISMLGTSVDAVNENEIIVEVFPNRPDLLSEQGMVRALSSFISLKKGLHEYKVKKSGCKVRIDPSGTMRPYTACAIVKNLVLTDERIKELMNIQEKLATTHGRNRKKSAYGIYPLNTIHFPIAYIAKDPKTVEFQPLGLDHVISAAKIEELHPKGKEYRSITAGWKKYPFFIDAEDKVLSMLPYTNAHETGKVEITTKDVFVECSGIDLQNVTVALNILVTMLADMGGAIYSIEMDYGKKKFQTPDLTPKKMQVSQDYVNKRLGLSLSVKEIKNCLERMGYAYTKNAVLVPAYRADLLHAIDLVEDIAIAYGYEHFKEEIPEGATIAQEDLFEVFRKKVCAILIGYKLQEIHTYNLTNKENVNKKMRVSLDCVELSNALTSDYNILRPWVLPSVMQVFAENTHYEYPQGLFTTGTIFRKDTKTETGVREQTRLVVAIAGRDSNFTAIKQIWNGLCQALAITGELHTTQHPSFIHGRVGRGKVLDTDVAYVGEIHPEVLANWNIEMPIAALELNLTELFEVTHKK